MVGAHILLSGDQGAHHQIAFFIDNLQEMDFSKAAYNIVIFKNYLF